MSIVFRIFRKLYYIYCQFAKIIWVGATGISVGRNTLFLGMPIISRVAGSNITLGDRVVLCSNSRFTELGVSKAVILRTLRPGATINIGNNSGLSGTTVCAAISVVIGRDCLIGADVVITDCDFHAISPENRRYEKRHEKILSKAVVIGNNVFLGARSTILKGVTIGDNSVVGAGSVVTSSIPENVIAAGNPARVIRSL